MNANDWVSMSVFTFSLLTSILFLKGIRDQQQQREKIRREPVKNIEQLRDLKVGESGLFKVKVETSGIYQMKVPFGMNEKYIREPSDEAVIRSLDQFFQTKITWLFRVTDKQLVQVQGGGPYYHDLVEARRYVDEEQIGMGRKVLGMISYVVQLVLGLVIPRKNSALTRGPFIKGPEIGQVVYHFSMMRDCYILVKLRKSEGKLIFQYLASSKQKILDFYLNNIFGLTLLLLADAYFIKIFSSQAKVGFQKLYYKVKKLLKKPKMTRPLTFEDCPDDKTCSICYHNNRNIIILDCRHLVLCHECADIYDQPICPICKSFISEMKMIEVESDM